MSGPQVTRPRTAVGTQFIGTGTVGSRLAPPLPTAGAYPIAAPSNLTSRAPSAPGTRRPPTEQGPSGRNRLIPFRSFPAEPWETGATAQGYQVRQRRPSRSQQALLSHLEAQGGANSANSAYAAWENAAQGPPLRTSARSSRGQGGQGRGGRRSAQAPLIDIEAMEEVIGPRPGSQQGFNPFANFAGPEAAQAFAASAPAFGGAGVAQTACFGKSNYASNNRRRNSNNGQFGGNGGQYGQRRRNSFGQGRGGQQNRGSLNLSRYAGNNGNGNFGFGQQGWGGQQGWAGQPQQGWGAQQRRGNNAGQFGTRRRNSRNLNQGQFGY